MIDPKISRELPNVYNLDIKMEVLCGAYAETNHYIGTNDFEIIFDLKKIITYAKKGDRSKHLHYLIR